MYTYKIREIEEKDNKQVEYIIRSCLIEFGGNREGTAWCDPNLGCFSELYDKPGHKYWVVENQEGIVVGGAGIGALTTDVCELQKMYCLEEARGTGAAHNLMQKKSCSLATIPPVNICRCRKIYYICVGIMRPYIKMEAKKM